MSFFSLLIFFRDFAGFFQKEAKIYFELELTLVSLRRDLKEKKASNQNQAELK